MIITNELKKDLLEYNAPYIRKGNLYFNSISVDLCNKEFYIAHNGKVLARWPVENWDAGEIITLEFTEGRMKIKVT